MVGKCSFLFVCFSVKPSLKKTQIYFVDVADMASTPVQSLNHSPLLLILLKVFNKYDYWMDFPVDVKNNT